MRLDLGCGVKCTDAAFGELADIIVDPISRRVTHIVVEPDGHHTRARLVPIERARPAGDGIALDCSTAEIEALEPVHESAYVRAGERIAADPDWDIGPEDVLALPVYQELNGMGTAIDPDPHVMVSYDRIPKHEVEIRRSSAVFSTDGHHLGHVEAFLIGGGNTADIVLERGHLWGRREVAIPIGAVATVKTDAVTIDLTREQVGELPAARVQRWSR